MTHETDFLELYRRLGLSPGCELAELKQAYRRHVSMWHPDRQGGVGTDARTPVRLQRLTAQYGAAMEFHRRHGRLPGAPAPARAPAGESTAMAEAPVDPFAMRQPLPSFVVERREAGRDPLPSRQRRRGKLAAWLVVVALGMLAWSAYEVASRAGAAYEDAPEAMTQPMEADSEAAQAPLLRTGMSPDDVRAIEGEPLVVHGELWEYGPSWVRFDHGAVVEWHSSPLRALHTGDKAVQGATR